MSPEYRSKYDDPRWQKMRLEIMQRDSFRCRDCGNSHNKLNVHHCRYVRNPWEVEPIFLLTLCESSHEKRQELENAAKLAMALIFAQSTPQQLKSFADMLSGIAAREKVNDLESFWLGQMEFMSETRWIQYGKAVPAMRPHVEAVLGKIVDWSAP